MIKQQKQAGISALSRENEYAIIRKDLYRVLILNVVYLGGLLAIYFINKNNHFLDQWFAKILNF